MTIYKFTTVFIPVKEGNRSYWDVKVPALPEIVTFGDSLEEARFMAQDALELVVLCRLDDGEDIPANRRPSRIPKGAVLEDMLVTIVHEVHSTPVTQDVKAAFS